MSAQGYTNKRRVLAEASLRKVQYPGSIGLNNNPLYASINCSPNFNKVVYLIKLCCFKTPQDTLPDGEYVIILGAGGASSIVTEIVSGGGASMTAEENIAGGYSSGPEINDIIPLLSAGRVSTGDSLVSPTEIVEGGGASSIATDVVSGGLSGS